MTRLKMPLLSLLIAIPLLLFAIPLLFFALLPELLLERRNDALDNVGVE